jgi:hypothetical protein
VKEAIRKKRVLAPETTTWIDKSADHEEGRWQNEEQLSTLATIWIIARADENDLTIWSPENAEPDYLLMLIREALLVQPAQQIWFHAGPDHEEGKWRDGERVEVERPASIRVEYPGREAWVEVPAGASDDEVRAMARMEMGVQPEADTGLKKATNHGTTWVEGECIELTWADYHEGPPDVDVTFEWAGRRLNARLPRRTHPFDTMLWARAAFRIPASECLKHQAWIASPRCPVKVPTDPLRETLYTLTATDPLNVWNRANREYQPGLVEFPAREVTVKVEFMGKRTTWKARTSWNESAFKWYMLKRYDIPENFPVMIDLFDKTGRRQHEFTVRKD